MVFFSLLCLYFVNFSQLLSFCYPLSSATLRHRVFVYFTPVLASALDHTFRSVLVVNSYFFTFYFAGWCFVTHHLICIFGCHAQKRRFICDERSLSPFARGYTYMISHAMLVEEFSFHVLAMTAGGLFF